MDLMQVIEETEKDFDDLGLQYDDLEPQEQFTLYFLTKSYRSDKLFRICTMAFMDTFVEIAEIAKKSDNTIEIAKELCIKLVNAMKGVVKDEKERNQQNGQDSVG